MVQVNHAPITESNSEMIGSIASDAVRELDTIVRGIANGAVSTLTFGHTADELAGEADTLVFGGDRATNIQNQVTETEKRKQELGGVYTAGQLTGDAAGLLTYGRVIAGAGSVLATGIRAAGFGGALDTVAGIGGQGIVGRTGRWAALETGTTVATNMLSADPATAASQKVVPPLPNEKPKTEDTQQPAAASDTTEPTLFDNPVFKFVLENPELRSMAIGALDTLESLCKEMPMLANILNTFIPGFTEQMTGMKNILEHPELLGKNPGAAPLKPIPDPPMVKVDSASPTAPAAGQTSSVPTAAHGSDIASLRTRFPTDYHTTNMSIPVDVKNLNFDPGLMPPKWQEFLGAMEPSLRDSLFNKMRSRAGGMQVQFSDEEKQVMKTPGFIQAIEGATTVDGVAHPFGTNQSFNNKPLPAGKLAEALHL